MFCWCGNIWVFAQSGDCGELYNILISGSKTMVDESCETKICHLLSTIAINPFCAQFQVISIVMHELKADIIYFILEVTPRDEQHWLICFVLSKFQCHPFSVIYLLTHIDCDLIRKMWFYLHVLHKVCIVMGRGNPEVSSGWPWPSKTLTLVKGKGFCKGMKILTLTLTLGTLTHWGFEI